MSQNTVSVSSFDYLLLAIAGAHAGPDAVLGAAALEALGARVGEKLVERVAHEQRHALFASPDDALRFVCRDIWTLATRKPADRLRVTRRGAWEVQDLAFSWIAHVSAPHPSTGIVDIPARSRPTPSSSPSSSSPSSLLITRCYVHTHSFIHSQTKHKHITFGTQKDRFKVL